MKVFARFLTTLLTLLSHYRRHPGQALFMAIGLVTGVALWFAVQLINTHARASYAEADQLLGAEARYFIRGPAGQGVAVDDYISLRRAGFTGVYPVLEARVLLQGKGYLSIIATDLLALPQGERSTSPFAAADWLPLITPDYQAWFPATLATQLGVNPGERLMLADGNQLPPAVIRSRAQQGQRVFMDIGAAMAVLEQSRFSYLAVTSLDAAAVERLQSTLPVGLVLVPNQQAIDLSQLTQSLHTNLAALGLLSFCVGLFIVFNAVRFSLLARMGTLTTLRELGVSVGVISLAIVTESILWALGGTGAGIVLGYWLGYQLLPAVALSLQSLYGASLGATLALDPAQVMLAFLLTLIGVALALAVPLWQKVREPVLSGRNLLGFWSREEESARQMAILALTLLGAAVAGYSFITMVEYGFLVLALVMFGGALLLPFLIRLVVKGLADLLPGDAWLMRWSVSDVLAQLPHLRVALMALLLTLTANIGVTTLVGSFRIALENWLETRLSASVYVQRSTLDLTSLEGADWLVDAHQRLAVRLRWGGRPVTIRGLDVGAPDTVKLVLAAAQDGGFDAWRVGQGDPVPILANEQVQYLGGVDLGDVVTLETASGSQNFAVAGFFHDYGNPAYQFYLPRERLASLWPDAIAEGIALWVADGRIADAEAGLVRAGAEAGDWVLQDDIKAISFGIFDRTFAITAALNVLTLLVAGAALLAALLAVHQSRLPEYSHWRSLGVRVDEWLRIVALPIALMVLLTFLAALPLGYILSWLLIHKLNVIAFGWTMPLVWSWQPVVELVGMTLVIVFSTFALAVLRVRLALPVALRQLAGAGG
ncbi:MAG: FtsX-like permease family protein [Pseudomonadota bacterium]